MSLEHEEDKYSWVNKKQTSQSWVDFFSSKLFSLLKIEKRKNFELREDLEYLTRIAHSWYSSIIEVWENEGIKILWESEKVKKHSVWKFFKNMNFESLKWYVTYSRLHPNETIFTDITIKENDNTLYLTIKFDNEKNHFYFHFIPAKDTYTTIKNDFWIMIDFVEVRDSETAEHQKRVTEMSVELSKLTAKIKKYSELIDQNFIDKMRVWSALHDVGKIWIPDSILLSPNKLTPDEMNQIRRHSEIGAKMIEKLEEKFWKRKVIDFARNIALYHHERYSGTGYPYWLEWDEIPLPAQIVAIIDVFDALMSRRPYKKPLSIPEVKKIMEEWRWKDFNPEILDLFLENFEKFCFIRNNFPDKKNHDE